MSPGESPPDPRDARQRELLRAQPWGRLLGQLTAIALKRIRGRSLADAKDLAQSAIADAYRSVAGGGWDPDRGPLVAFLVGRVISTAGNERRRKRNACEVWLGEEAAEDEAVSAYEKHLAADAPPPDEALGRLRFASTFAERLLARLAGDEPALEIVALMKEGLASPRELAEASGRPVEEIREARRRVRYHADEITKELSAAARRTSARGKEISQ